MPARMSGSRPNMKKIRLAAMTTSPPTRPRPRLSLKRSARQLPSPEKTSTPASTVANASVELSRKKESFFISASSMKKKPNPSAAK